ncbi:hypothetical protein [Ferrimicrobium acidiphilum]|uniref:hypothetical protein n=1 Tax=Ferrimicrobium acidiphilum TaxID=121039 RepID=UPI0023F29E77|nr:hypothetical protein [Ferrimicrobium acidiphilum]
MTSQVISVEALFYEIQSLFEGVGEARLIGIDGFGASGKSILAAGLGTFFDAAVVHTDEFYKSSA